MLRLEGMRIGSSRCTHQDALVNHVRRDSFRQRSSGVQHARSQAQPAKDKRGRPPKKGSSKKNAGSSGFGGSSRSAQSQQVGGREELLAEIEQLQSQNQRMRQRLTDAATILRSSGKPGGEVARLTTPAAAAEEPPKEPAAAAARGTGATEPSAESPASAPAAGGGTDTAKPAAAPPAPASEALPPAAADANDAAASLEFLEFQPIAGAATDAAADPASNTQSATQQLASTAASAAAPVGAAAEAAAAETTQPPSRTGQSSSGGSRDGGEAPRQQAAPGVEQAEQLLDIVFVSSEAGPWSKTGGLGDVVGSLPIALSRRGHRVMVVTPRYQNGTETDRLYDVAEDLHQPATLDMGACGQVTVNFHHAHQQGVDWVFVDHPCYQRAGGLYTDENGVFGDNQFRFALLSLAACEAPLVLNIGGHRVGWPPGFPYGDRCVFVANDWHASLVPVYLAGRYRRHGVYKDARSILAIHNMAHQGVEPAATFANLGVPDDIYDPMGWEYPSWSHVNGPAVNLLKGGVLTADRVMTVSKGYAWEITTAEGGWGLDGVLQGVQHKLDGIANGIDTDEWSPELDRHLPARYSAADMAGKAECKAALQRELGLPEDAAAPLLGFIGRLDFQKGPDLVLAAAGELAARNVQLVMLGSGGDEYETAMRDMERQHPNHFRGWVGFSVPVAHRMVAGCDALLMPSRFEPCGLNQLFAMAYGTVPIAHATGGLRDTIAAFQPDKAGTPECGTGFVFSPPEANAMLQAVDHAVHLFRNDRKAWEGLQAAGMAQDLSWERAAKEYEQIFGWALMDEPVRPW